MNPDRILVIGDSWSDCLWPHLLGIPESHMQAVSGSTAAQWASDFDGRLTKAASTPADILLVSLMGNDLRHAMLDGVVTDDEKDAACDAMRYVCATARKAQNIAMLYAVPTVAPNNLWNAASLLNDVVKSAIPKDFELFHSNYFLRDKDFLPDGIHTNYAGQFAIACEMKKIVCDL